jgi:hypothetical protein
MRSTGAPPAGESKEKARENYSFSLSCVEFGPLVSNLDVISTVTGALTRPLEDET